MIWLGVLMMSAAIAATDTRNPAVMMMSSPIHLEANTSVRFSVYIKTSGVEDGVAGLCWQHLARGMQTMHFQSVAGSFASGTSEWKRYELIVPAFPDASDIRLGVAMNGPGTAWFNSFAYQVGTQPEKTVDFDAPVQWRSVNGYDNAGYQVDIVKRWLRAPASDPEAARDNAGTLVLRATASE